jgi:integrase
MGKSRTSTQGASKSASPPAPPPPGETTKAKVRRRSAGEGSVYETGDRWRGAVTWTDAAGTRHRRTITSPTSKGARDKLDKLRQDLGLGVLDDGKPETLGQFLERWIVRHRGAVRFATWRTRETHVREYLIPALGKVPLRKLGAERIELALGTFQAQGRPNPKPGPGRPARPLSPLTVRHIRSTLRRALADAERDGKVGRNAAAAAASPYVPHRPIVYLSARDVRKMLEASRDHPFGPVYELAVTTGLRLGELLGLTWADVTDGKLAVRRALARSAAPARWSLADTKTMRSRRTIPLSLAARHALETQRTRQAFVRNAAGTAWQDQVGLVFTDAVGRHLAPERVSHQFVALLKASGLPQVHFHDLRHTSATLMLAQGVPLAVISEWLGHSSITITASSYAAIVPELHLEAADAMDRAIGGEP